VGGERAYAMRHGRPASTIIYAEGQPWDYLAPLLDEEPAVRGPLT